MLLTQVLGYVFPGALSTPTKTLCDHGPMHACWAWARFSRCYRTSLLQWNIRWALSLGKDCVRPARWFATSDASHVYEGVHSSSCRGNIHCCFFELNAYWGLDRYQVHVCFVNHVFFSRQLLTTIHPIIVGDCLGDFLLFPEAFFTEAV